MAVAKLTDMTRGTRFVVSILAGFVTYRITTEFLDFWVALVLGLAVLTIGVLALPAKDAQKQ